MPRMELRAAELQDEPSGLSAPSRCYSNPHQIIIKDCDLQPFVLSKGVCLPNVHLRSGLLAGTLLTILLANGATVGPAASQIRFL